MHIAIDIAHTSTKNNNYEKIKTETELICFGNKAEDDLTNEVNKILNELRHVLIKAGALNVTIQPHILGAIHLNEIKLFSPKWKSCTTVTCSEENGCCIQPQN